MNLTILIGMAEGDTTRRFTRFLAQSGFDVLQANRGTDCWDLLQREQPDVLILDEALPWGGDGILARLREEADAESPPVVLLAHPGSVQSQSFGRGLRRDDAFPVVARFSKSVSLPRVLNAVLGGLRHSHRGSCDIYREDVHEVDSQVILV